MTTQPHDLVAADGRVLAATVFHPDTEPRATVVVLPALAVPARYYRHFGAWLAEQGFRALTFDPRGIGGSLQGHVRDEPANLTDWAERDYRAALRWLLEQPGPHLGVSHSLGGQFAGILDEYQQLDGLYTIASQIAHWRGYPGMSRYAMWARFALGMPALCHTVGYLPKWSGLGEDVPSGVILQWSRWLLSPGYLLDHVDGAADRFRRFRGPVRVTGFSDDSYAPPNMVHALAACYPPDRTQCRIFEPSELGLEAVGHFGAFRPLRTDDGPRPHPAWSDVLAHLSQWTDAAG